ncbi:MAG: hypothetical protein JETT_2874 [Candidatus Jettenia ecosi]|uniref:Uncharacterized protein n=1 Tax=Candidatus Jettenia ecosi TaxID=2494326 RepID=A0A533Q8F0_9BACT|nr:MAG: hypothetical protein JETT_2874 [Candidatus Jettenia ecosi]
MVSSRKERSIPLNTISGTLEKGLSGTDAERKMGIEGLMRVRDVKATRLEREKLRLSKKLGANHPRVMELTNTIEVNRGLIRDLEVQRDHAGTEIPGIDENTWILHGFVRDKHFKGIPTLTVALYDQQGKWVEQLGYACTDKTGYFKLSYSHMRDDREKPWFTTLADKTRQGPQVFIRISDQKGMLLYTDKQPVIPEPGQVDYREILLGDEVDMCKPPEGTMQPKPGTEKPTTKPSPQKEDQGTTEKPGKRSRKSSQG